MKKQIDTSYTLGEHRKYEDLIKGRFELKVMRIEHKYDALKSYCHLRAQI